MNTSLTFLPPPPVRQVSFFPSPTKARPCDSPPRVVLSSSRASSSPGHGSTKASFLLDRFQSRVQSVWTAVTQQHRQFQLFAQLEQTQTKKRLDDGKFSPMPPDAPPPSYLLQKLKWFDRSLYQLDYGGEVIAHRRRQKEQERRRLEMSQRLTTLLEWDDVVVQPEQANQASSEQQQELRQETPQAHPTPISFEPIQLEQPEVEQQQQLRELEEQHTQLQQLEEQHQELRQQEEQQQQIIMAAPIMSTNPKNKQHSVQTEPPRQSLPSPPLGQEKETNEVMMETMIAAVALEGLDQELQGKNEPVTKSTTTTTMDHSRLFFCTPVA